MSAGKGGASAKGQPDPHLNVTLPSGAVVVVPLAGHDVTVGKSEKNGLVLDDPAVSSTHAIFRWTGKDWLVADLASRNGVFVNHHQVAGSCVLRLGDQIQIGHCHILFTVHVPSPADPKKSDRAIKKRRAETKATYIKLSGALIAKVIGPIVTLLLGLLISGQLVRSCRPASDSDGTAPTSPHIAFAAAASVAPETMAPMAPSHLHHGHRHGVRAR